MTIWRVPAGFRKLIWSRSHRHANFAQPLLHNKTRKPAVKIMSNALLCAGLLASAGLMTTPAVAAMQGPPGPMPAMPNMPMRGPPPEMTGPITAERPATDVARDAMRKPLEIMAFAGVRPGMTVAELGPGFGYYTRMLSKAVGPRGKVYALFNSAQPAFPGMLDRAKTLAALLGNVEVVVCDYTAINLPTKADLFWTTENYHDFHNGPTANIPALDKSVYDNLKPGGIFYVEDHSAAEGAGLEATSKLHRMDEALAKTELLAAGFKLEAETDLLRNPNDSRVNGNSENGHYTSDRFGLRLRKPA
jgi:predicted methyltransferase